MNDTTIDNIFEQLSMCLGCLSRSKFYAVDCWPKDQKIFKKMCAIWANDELCANHPVVCSKFLLEKHPKHGVICPKGSICLVPT